MHVEDSEPPRPARRLESIDILRGLLMILMALDHVRDFFSGAQVDPVDPVHSWPALFATRWITHLCAPGFVALAGASVYLQRERGKSPAQIQKLLLTRGLWFIFLELTVNSFGWFFYYPAFNIQVLWAIGISMLALAFLQRFAWQAVGCVGAAIMLGHNLLDPIHVEGFGLRADLWKIFHQGGILFGPHQVFAYLLYPFFPWIGVICLGYAFGPLASSDPAGRPRRAALLGVISLAIFSLLRAFHGYGDDQPFTHLSTPAHTLMSFMNVEKYPPSLHYVLATFGVLLLLYALFDLAATRDWVPRVRGFVETYGRVPFFYYILHIYVVHLSAIALTVALGLDWHHWFKLGGFMGDPLPGWGFSLPVVYTVWAAIVLAFYLPCRWFSRLKARRRDWWLSYL